MLLLLLWHFDPFLHGVFQKPSKVVWLVCPDAFSSGHCVVLQTDLWRFHEISFLLSRSTFAPLISEVLILL